MDKKEQTHYYLIGGEIKKGGYKPQYRATANETECDKYKLDYDLWKQSLQPCSITDVELEKVKCYILLNTILTLNNTIDVTGIVEESIKKCDCCIIDCLPTRCLNPKVTLVFKQPKSEANEAVDEIWDDVRAFISQTYDIDSIMKNLKEHFNITPK